MGFQEVGNSLVGVNLVFDFREAVAFIFVDFVFDYAAAFLDRIDYLLRFLLRAARVVASG